jgi:maleate cis-trans isomerase
MESTPSLASRVITCNQATLWAALRAAGIDDRLEDRGLLLKKY